MEFSRFRTEEGDALVDFLTGEEWPFHVESTVDGDGVLARVAAGFYTNAFWIRNDLATLGLVRLMDLDDGTPLFDLRVRSAARGRGVGTSAVAWLTAHIFTNFTTDRVEGTTRQDNHAMRHVFAKAGYVKEAHYRDAWPSRGGLHDSVGYAILRRDWKDGVTTPVDWSS
jgi:RimJ/RimL family protein N-acetyltransferase